MKSTNRIRFVHYNFPLDSSCNKNLHRAVYPNSCTASGAMFAAAGLGILEKYLNIHFSDYQKIINSYSVKSALNILEKSGEGNKKKIFLSLLKSGRTNSMIRRDIDSAKKIGIKVTPTIFIDGRRIEGIYPGVIYERIIENLLDKKI